MCNWVRFKTQKKAHSGKLDRVRRPGLFTRHKMEKSPQALLRCGLFSLSRSAMPQKSFLLK